MAQPATAPARGYGSAAPTYVTLGWIPIPLPPGEKSPPPKGFTGIDGATPDAQQIERWSLTRPTSNIGLHMSNDVIGIDVDDYDDKHGGQLLAELIALHGELPATWSSTSRGEGASRILFFRVTPGLSFPGQLGAGIEVIQKKHRYAVVAPSVHPDTGDRYRWYTPTGEVATMPPAVDDLATLPEVWEQALQWVAPEPKPLPPTKPHASTFDESDSIAERINHDHDWHNLLIGDGWHLSADKHASTEWTRPGKDPRKGISAVLHEPSGPFNVFTTTVGALCQSWALDPQGIAYCYSIFGYLAATRYNGDRSATAREYRMRANNIDARHHTLQTATTAVQVLDDVEKPEDDWAPIDLAEIAGQIRRGELQPIMPTILDVRDSFPLLYKGRTNSLFGESGGGKSWVALAAACSVVRAGGRVLFIDYEDNPNGIAERLVLLGLTDDEITLVDYRNPTSGIGYGIATLQERALAGEYELVVIDSTGEAMAAGGVDSNADAEVANWFAIVKTLFKLPGAPGVLVLDHVPKDKDAPSSYAIGSQRKRAAVTGASYRVDTIREPAKGRDGALKLTVAKDRPGNRPKGSVAAIVDLQSIDGEVVIELHLSDAQVAEAAGEKFRPTVYMERVSRWVEINPRQPKRQLVLDVRGKRGVLDAAIEVLLEEGWMSMETGDRGSKLFKMDRSYREYDDPKAVVGVQPRTYEPSMNPGVNSQEESCRAPMTPPLQGGPTGARQTMGNDAPLPRTELDTDEPVETYEGEPF